jgi:hypothetical protein
MTPIVLDSLYAGKTTAMLGPDASAKVRALNPFLVEMH